MNIAKRRLFRSQFTNMEIIGRERKKQ